MQTYFSNAQELWEHIKNSEQLMSRDFELAYYGNSDEVAGYVLMYKGLTHDIYKVNKTVELFYNKLVSDGFKDHVQLTYRKLNRPDKYRERKKEAVIELFPGFQAIEEDEPGEED